MPSRASDADRRVSLSWIRRGGVERLRIEGLDPPGRRPPPGLALLPAALVQAALETPSLQPLGGRFTVDGEGLCFTPQLPFVEGMSYALMLRGPDADVAPGVWTIERPTRAHAPSATVTGLFPSAPVAPLNLLKIYVHFSAPMTEGCSDRAVEVRRGDTGEVLDDVFFLGRSELWDRARRRLTLLLDPGRIKRGLGPHEAMGYPLAEGAWVEVRITERFLDAQGAPLRAGAVRRYRIGAPLREHVDPARWRRRWPAVGSCDPLVVNFDRPLDHALLQHALRVTDGEGAPMAGRVTVGASEKSWRFYPDQPWREGRYTLVVDPVLEDLAGNSLTRVFDRDLEKAEDAPARGQEPIRFSRSLVARRAREAV